MHLHRNFSTPWILPIALAIGSPGVAQLTVPLEFPTIQAAVDAAVSGDTILVASGVYAEQVKIVGKDLTLIGDAGATLQAFPGMVDTLAPLVTTKNVLAAFQSNVRVSGFTFDGQGLSASGFFLVGVYLAAADAEISNCQFLDFRSTPYGLEFSRAVTGFNLSSWDAPKRQVSVLDSTFLGCHDAILLGGDDTAPNDLRIVAHVRRNTIVGQGAGAVTQRGVWFAFGVGGGIRDNSISDHVFLGETELAVGILTGSLVDPPFELVVPTVIVKGNVLSNNTVGIAGLFNEHSTILSNDVASGPLGLAGVAVSGRGNKIVKNAVDMSASQIQGNSAIALLGFEYGGPLGFGIAVDTKVIHNTIVGADLPPFGLSVSINRAWCA
jgi:hypothetical protein